MPNRLISARSLYLRQHADNPVDWYPWGEEAFRAARERDCPILVSIGYSACHWCHVMERESFSDPAVAEFLNAHFVSIKVDREEHPEVDAQYMEVAQLLSGHGGWPLNVFLTPELHPFFAGTYFPPTRWAGLPSFLDVLQAVVDAWQHRRLEVNRQAAELHQLLSEASRQIDGGQEQLDLSVLEAAERKLADSFDPSGGGFGPAPKFPHPSTVRFLLTRAAVMESKSCLGMAVKTLDAMALGGMHDHIGGGFHRYATDQHWLIPHFEKMLYDNALLARAYVEAYRYTQRPLYAQVARSTLDYLLRDMARPGGGFYSSQDADSEGQEGKFYLWSLQEVKQLLGPRADLFADFYHIRSNGLFEGMNIPNLVGSYDRLLALPESERIVLEQNLAECRATLLAARMERIPPSRDEKILLSWNAFVAEALLWAGRVLSEPRYLSAGETTLNFLLENLWPGQKHMYHCWYEGQGLGPPLLEDVAALAVALTTAYETTLKPEYLQHAYRLAEMILEHYFDPHTATFYMTEPQHPGVLSRRLDYLDNPTPSGTSLVAELLLRLGHLLAEPSFLQTAQRSLAALSGWMSRTPQGVGHALLVAQQMAVPYSSWVVVLPTEASDSSTSSDPLPDFLTGYFTSFLPGAILAVAAKHSFTSSSCLLQDRIFAHRPPVNHLPTLYLCQAGGCQPPVTGREAILAQIATHAKHPSSY